MSKTTIENSSDLFEIEIGSFNNNNGEQLPISFFQEIEADLCDRLMLTYRSSPKEDQTDGALEFIQNIADNVRSEFEGFLRMETRKNS